MEPLAACGQAWPHSLAVVAAFLPCPQALSTPARMRRLVTAVAAWTMVLAR